MGSDKKIKLNFFNNNSNNASSSSFNYLNLSGILGGKTYKDKVSKDSGGLMRFKLNKST
mgnify:CR=1 FL=1